MIDFSLIQPPTQLRTMDSLITVASDKDIAIINLTTIQPRLYKRLTKKRKALHMSSLLQHTKDIFGCSNLIE